MSIELGGISSVTGLQCILVSCLCDAPNTCFLAYGMMKSPERNTAHRTMPHPWPCPSQPVLRTHSVIVIGLHAPFGLAEVLCGWYHGEAW